MISKLVHEAKGCVMPEISVVIPTRSRSGLLVRTLKSVLGQIGVDLEVVIADDGSEDDTVAAVSALGDPRIRVVQHSRPRGVSAARNLGMSHATGEWIAFLDDDDLWAPDKLREQIALAKAQRRNWAYCGVIVVDSALRVIAGGPPPSAEAACRRLPWRNTVPGGASNVLVRARLLDEVGQFDETLRRTEDWDMWIRLSLHGLPAVVTRPWVAYVIHETNSSRGIDEFPSELAVVEERYAHLRNGGPADRAYVFRWMAWNSLRLGRQVSAIRSYARAVAAGDWKSLGRIAVAAVYPQVVRRQLRHQQPPREWSVDANTWLTPFREPSGKRDTAEE